MASWTPVVLQNENAPTHIGKHGNGVKINAKRPVKRGLQERRSLQDLTNTGKPQVSAPSKGSILKDKSAISSRQRTKNILKGPFLNDEELRRCHEWAKDGIVHAYFTGNDLQKLHKDAEDNRVKKKVQKVMSALREWSTTGHDGSILHTEEAPEELLDASYIELQDDMLPLSGNKEMGDILFETELDGDLPICQVVLELKEED